MSVMGSTSDCLVGLLVNQLEAVAHHVDAIQLDFGIRVLSSSGFRKILQTVDTSDQNIVKIALLELCQYR